jgi:hypothetical protein
MQEEPSDCAMSAVIVLAQLVSASPAVGECLASGRYLLLASPGCLHWHGVRRSFWQWDAQAHVRGGGRAQTRRQ